MAKSKSKDLNKADYVSIGTNTLLVMASVYVPLLTVAVMNPKQIDTILFDLRFFGVVVAFAIFKTIQKYYEGGK